MDGDFRAVMVLPDGNRIHWAGEYTEVDPTRRLAMTLTDNPDAYAGSPVLFDLVETTSGTESTISQDRADFSVSRRIPITFRGDDAAGPARAGSVCACARSR
ncbi:SRPBCC family protein [Microbacterium pygmaeum]|uniref:SRPBCC family protein n=1 Tax=Microbacterium pygmaeum TaxID=370764 RepID=UPI000B80B1AD|nr:SRPBCC domain-containing protein [Microbacterium pygmaeum]